MNRPRALLSACALFAMLSGCGDSHGPRADGGPVDAGVRVDAGGRLDAGPGTDAGPDDRCNAAGDCAWGEIDHEILSATDCICLFGCPSLIQNRTTVARRMSQYDALCTPGRDGMGNPCPIDDCIPPPPLACEMNVCVMSADGGT